MRDFTSPSSIRVVAPFGCALAFAAFVLAHTHSGLAANPSSGTLSPSSGPLTFTSGPFTASNPTPVPAADNGPRCNANTNPCDSYALTVQLPEGFAAANPDARVKITTSWTPADADVDLWVYNGNQGDLDGSDGGVADGGATSSNPESVSLDLTADLSKLYTVKIVPFAASGVTATTTIEMIVPPPPPADEDGDGVPDDTPDQCPGTPPGTPVDDNGCEITEPPGPECEIPGLSVLTDADDDHTGGNQGFDIRSLSISEQNYSTGRQLRFTLKVDSLATPPPTGARWVVPFTGADGKFYFVRATLFADSTNPIFQYGTAASATAAGAAGGGCFSPGTGLDPASKMEADGTITMVVNAADLGALTGGQSLTGITAVAQQLSGSSSVCVVASNNDTASANPPASYKVSTSCPVITIEPPGPPSGLPPRFYDFQSPQGLADRAGEPSIGYNPATQRAMFIAGTEVDQVTWAENAFALPDAADLGMLDAAGHPLPESCPALWQDRSYSGAARTLDPILETYQPVGRTFQSSLTGANSIFAFSDSDGEPTTTAPDGWTPGQVGPPNGGADHQTVGVGPWAPGAKPPTATVDYAIYYCSQSLVAAFCSRSDDGGVSFGPGIDFSDLLTGCDGQPIHGHAQVAPNDGTVYVPIGNCGGKVSAVVSTDSGITWAVKSIAQSSATAGGDPGIGVASDGTVYACYSEGGGKTYASVSKDRGNTWSEHYDLGGALGIQNTVFTTMVAGDPDRAACMFLGTTTPGNYQGLDFPGVWYPYASATYDGGKSWHTVSVSGSDPVQGAGGICTGGLNCGTNRNLLDFNDIQMDENGRVLVAYADGCNGPCVLDPTHNSGTANGVIGRQSGGRTLLAAHDDEVGTQFNSETAMAPTAACARADLSTRNLSQTRVAWTSPDNGGSAITNYKVYRATSAGGPFGFVGDAGPKNYFLDATADTNVPLYFYRVVAQNAPGMAPASNIIKLPIVVGAGEDSCVLPGITIVTESSPGDCIQGCSTQTDLQKIYAAELPDQPDQIVFTIKVGDLNPAPAPGTYWYLLTKKLNGENLYLAMDTEQGAPRYYYGTYSGGLATSFGPGEPQFDPELVSGSTDVAGNIHLFAAKSLFGAPNAGDVISSVEARTRQGNPEAASLDSIGPNGYTFRGVDVCLPNTPPIAVLTASVQTGDPGLQVTFGGGDSYDTDTNIPDTIKTYLIDFGDGTGDSAENGATPMWDHVYSNPGVYSAKLKVIDSRGAPSENSAERVIEISKDQIGPTVSGPVFENNKLGGALSLAGLFGLGLLGAVRIRRRR